MYNSHQQLLPFKKTSHSTFEIYSYNVIFYLTDPTTQSRYVLVLIGGHDDLFGNYWSTSRTLLPYKDKMSDNLKYSLIQILYKLGLIKL